MGRREYDGRQCANAVEKEEVAMWRTFGIQALTGSAQPLFSDKLTAAMAIPPFGVDPILHVANTAKYQQGDRINIEPGTANQDTVLVTTILSGTTMQVTSQGAPYHAHATNSLLELDIPATEVTIQGKSTNGNSVWIGADNTITAAGGGNAIHELIPSGDFRMTQSGQFNTIRTSDAWVAGNLSDSFIPAAEII